MFWFLYFFHISNPLFYRFLSSSWENAVPEKPRAASQLPACTGGAGTRVLPWPCACWMSQLRELPCDLEGTARRTRTPGTGHPHRDLPLVIPHPASLLTPQDPQPLSSRLHLAFDPANRFSLLPKTGQRKPSMMCPSATPAF